MRRFTPVPPNWNQLHFGDIAVFKNGINFKSKESGYTIKVLGVGDFRDNTSLKTDLGLQDIPLSAKPSQSDFLENDDLVFVRSNGSKNLVGRCLHIKFNPEELTYSGFCIRGRIHSNKTSALYINMLMQLGILKKQLVKDGRGTNISNLNQGILTELPILLPPLAEQKAIAEVLSTWDEAIQTTQQLIQAKEKRFKGILQSFFLNVATLKYTEDSLEGLVKIKKGKQLNVAHMKDDGIYYALNGGITPSGRTNDWNTPSNTITISEGGNSCGYVSLNLENFWSGGHCYSLLDIAKSINTEYLFYFLKFNEPKIMRLRVGSGLPNIQKKDIEKFKILYPSLDMQRAIAETLSTAQAEIDLLKQLLEQYQTQKRGLMQKLLTGTWRIKSEIVKIYEVTE